MRRDPQPHRFTLELAGIEALSNDHLNALYEAGCDDATFGTEGGALLAEFDRRASSFAAAVQRAREQIERAVPQLRVARIVERDDDVVTASDIARRSGLTREAVRLLATGARGPGTFPRARATLGRQRLWHWPEVAAWFARARGARLRVEDGERRRFVRAYNSALELRAHGFPPGSAERGAVSEIVRDLARA